MKMIFTFVLASALAMSTVLGRSSGPTPIQMTYEKDHKTVMQSEETAQIMAIDDRSSNLKFVMAIKSSSIWAEIQKRSLTISTPQGLNETVDEKSLNNLSDQELAQLKQACNDGLKCVAVDHLLVLKQVKSSLGDGKVSVRTAITKITQVLTQYTTEYHEDVYQYEAVSDSDDESAVYKSVTTIVEDNKELCRIDLTPATVESQPKNYEGNAVPAIVVNNNNTVNYNTTNNYNINNGTFNAATINTKPQSEDTDGERPKHKASPVNRNAHAPITNGRTNIDSNNRSPDHHDVNADYQSAARDESVTKAPENTRSADDYRKPTEPATNNKTVLSRSNGNDATRQTVAQKTADNGVNNNTVLLNNSSNGTGDGENDSDSDFVNAGSHNKFSAKKGMVEDGILNNGKMKIDNTDNGNHNKGTIKNANADNGIINVGTTNNGPVNYGTADSYINNGTMLDSESYNINQVPRHIAIEGNELDDQQVKIATINSEFKTTPSPSYNDNQGHINDITNDKWLNLWKPQATKLNSIKRNTIRWINNSSK
ncbi:hypothetical protein ACI65C_010949 [Semiaphis heraclei]